ncbi:MAG: dipicolinate synthase subunit DpsA [Firmicutes bacterium]|nr:dipicolinate synthase subunit DpsA [Bacillota bacterium]
MGLDLKGIKIAVIGGDQRQLFLIPELVRLGADVTAVGFLPCPGLSQVQLHGTLEAALKDAHVLILPVQGTDPEGRIKTLDGNCSLTFTSEIAKTIPAGTLVIIGSAREILRNRAIEYGWKLIEIADLDEVAILNAIPSAEGALQIAMEQLPITIHNSKSFVLGFGRLGKTLARMLQGIGAQTTVVARGRADLARIFEMGYRPVSFAELPQVISEAEIIFNTVPALILDEQMLSLLQKDALIIDLASHPGGTDFAAAKKLGIQAILAPGLPGKVAPKTSGKILARVIPQLILRELSRIG